MRVLHFGSQVIRAELLVGQSTRGTALWTGYSSVCVDSQGEEDSLDAMDIPALIK